VVIFTDRDRYKVLCALGGAVGGIRRGSVERALLLLLLLLL